jgi:hypothetical protein
MSAPGPKWTCRPAHLMSASEGNTSASEGNADTVARTDTQGRAARETELGIAKRRICNRTRAIWMIPAATEEDKDKHSRGAIRPSDASSVALRSQRAQGMPGARTHPLPCVQNKKDARRPTQVRRNHSGTPCAMALRLTPCSPRGTGLVSPRRVYRSLSIKLDPSVGGSGPHGLTVRIDITRLRYQCVHRIPHHASWRSRNALRSERGTDVI